MTKEQKQKRIHYQKLVNNACISEMDNALSEFNALAYPRKWKKLNKCKADFIETTHYIILRSYNSFVCYFNKVTSNVYDCSRFVYGYTSTTTQHINKFMKLFYYENKYTYYHITDTKAWYKTLPAYFDTI